MRRALLFFILCCSIPAALCAQGRYDLRVPRFEIGAQFDFNYLDGVKVWGGGLGGRFTYNFNEHVALDASLTYRQHDVLPLGPALLAPPAIGQTNGLFGIRAGQRFEDYGFFGHARVGFTHFGSADGVSLLSRNTVPAFEVGGTIENYRGPVVLRFDLGELIVAYGNATVFDSQLVSPPPPPPVRLGTRASPMVGFGFAVRF